MIEQVTVTVHTSEGDGISKPDSPASSHASPSSSSSAPFPLSPVRKRSQHKSQKTLAVSKPSPPVSVLSTRASSSGPCTTQGEAGGPLDVSRSISAAAAAAAAEETTTTFSSSVMIEESNAERISRTVPFPIRSASTATASSSSLSPSSSASPPTTAEVHKRRVTHTHTVSVASSVSEEVKPFPAVTTVQRKEEQEKKEERGVGSNDDHNAEECEGKGQELSVLVVCPKGATREKGEEESQEEHCEGALITNAPILPTSSSSPRGRRHGHRDTTERPTSSEGNERVHDRTTTRDSSNSRSSSPSPTPSPMSHRSTPHTTASNCSTSDSSSSLIGGDGFVSQMNKIVAEEHPRPLEKNQSSPLPPLPHSARRAEEQKDTRVKAVPAAAKEEQVNVLPPILASPRVPAPAPSGLPVSSPSATAALVALCKASDWNPDPQRMQPLIVSGGADVFHLVEEGEVIPGTLNWPLFHLLVFKGRVEAVKACLSSKLPMDFTIRDEHYGRTPLHRACEACLSHEVSRQMLVAMARRLQNHPEDTVNWNQCDDFELTVVQSAANHQKLCLLWQLLGTEFAGVYDAHGNDEENTQRRRRRERRMASTPKNTSATEDPRRPSSLSSSSSVLLSSGLIPDAAPRPRERTGGAFPPRPPAGATPPSGMSAVVSGNHLPHSHSHSHSHHHRHQLRMSSSLTGHQAMGNGNEGFHYTVVSTSLQLDPERYGFLNLDGPIPLDTVWRWEWEALTAAGATRRYFKVKKNRIIDADEPTGELWRLATHHPQTAPASAIEALVSVGADVVFLKDNITILHRFIRAGAVNAVRACLQTQRHIDFTVKNDFLWTLFHSGVSPVTRAHRRDVSHVMMCAILDRLESHPGDGVDWSGTNCAGDNLLSTAAAYGKLSLLWNLLISRRIPYFHNYPGRIPITTKVYKKDWDQLSDEHQSRFNLIEGFETEELVSE